MLCDNDLAIAFNYVYLKARRAAVYVLNVPLTIHVVEIEEDSPAYFYARTYGRRIEVSRGFIKEIGDNYKQMAFVLVHEITHQMLGHERVLKRWGAAGAVTGKDRGGDVVTRPYHPHLAQWALDYLVNDFALLCGFELMPGVFHEPRLIGGWRDCTEDDLYVRVYAVYCDKEGPSNANGRPGCGGTDVTEHEEQPRIDEQQVRRRALQAAMAHNLPFMPGISSKDMLNIVERLEPERINWWEIVRPRYGAYCGHGAVDWSRGRKSAAAIGYFLPASKRLTAGSICWVIDVSSSITAENIAFFMGYNAQMIHETRPKQLIVMTVDATVTEVRVLYQYPQMRDWCERVRSGAVKLKGGGGTNMRMADRKLVELGLTPDLTLFLTDGYTPFPKSLGQSREVWWLMTTDTVAPEEAGRTYRLNP